MTACYGMADGKVFEEEILKDLAARHDRSVAQIVLRWLVQQDGIVALSQTVSEKRAATNFAIFDFLLSADDMAAISSLSVFGRRLVGPEGLAPSWG